MASCIHSQISNHTQEIASDENPRLLLVRDIAKAINEAKKEKATTSIDKTEYDLDLQRAIQLSLRSGKAESEDIVRVKTR